MQTNLKNQNKCLTRNKAGMDKYNAQFHEVNRKAAMNDKIFRSLN